MSSRFSTSLAFKLFGATFPLTALAVLLIHLAMGALNYGHNRVQLDQRAQLLAALTARAVARPLWTMDQRIYAAQIDALTSDPAFVHARLTDETGTEVFSLGASPPAGGGVMTVVEPVTDPVNGDKLGEFTLVMSTAELVHLARGELAVGAAAFVAILLAVFATLHGATRRFVLAPLKELLAAMGEVERKQWTTVSFASDDEMGRATRTFNRMVDGLRAGDEAKRLVAELEKANRLILDSIATARRIQHSLLPAPGALDGLVPELDYRWEPLHIVGGDYVGLRRLGGRALVLVADCTGHGVPGALMTVVVASALEEVLAAAPAAGPAELLAALDTAVRRRLRQDDDAGGSDDGLDAALLVWDSATRELRYAGANIPLMVRRADGTVDTRRGNRGSLGYRTLPPPLPLDELVVAAEPGMSIHLFTDGVADHMGGTPRRLFGRHRLAGLLAALGDRPLHERHDAILAALADYRGAEPRRDDLAMVSFRVE